MAAEEQWHVDCKMLVEFELELKLVESHLEACHKKR